MLRPAPSALWTAHEAYVFMYTTFQLVVLNKIPFIFDRLKKSKKQQEQDKKDYAKKIAKMRRELSEAVER